MTPLAGSRDLATAPVRWRHRAALAVLGVAVFAAVLAMAHRIGPLIYLPVSWDSWFDADTTRVFEDLSQHNSVLNRGAYHPLFGLLGHGPYQILSQLLGTGVVATVQIELALVSALLVVVFVELLFSIGLRWAESLVFGALLMSSAAFVFFSPIPETFSFGGVIILFGLVLAATAEKGLRGDLGLATALALAASATATNVLPVGLAVLLSRDFRSVARSGVIALAMLIAGGVGQAWLFPHAPSPLTLLLIQMRLLHADPNDVVTGDLVPPQSFAHLGRVLRAFFLHSTVMPEPVVGEHVPKLLSVIPSPLRTLTVQTAAVGSGSPWSYVALAGWLALLAWASWNTIRGPRTRAVLVLVVAIATQLAIHLFLGRETILYSLHFQPLLVAFAALSLDREGRGRKAVLVLAGVTAVLAGANNWLAFERTRNLLESWGRAIDLRPSQAIRSSAPPLPRDFPARFELPDLPVELAFERIGGGDLVVRGIEEQPGVWSIDVRTDGPPRSELMVRASEARVSAEPSDRTDGWVVSSPKGESAFLHYRWGLLTRPYPNATKPFNRPGESCGPLDSPCVQMRLGRGNRWRLVVLDVLERPQWLGSAAPFEPEAWRLVRPPKAQRPDRKQPG